MNDQIIIQPDGKLSLFSREENRFLVMLADENDIYEYLAKEEQKRLDERLILLKDNVKKVVKELRKGEKPFINLTLTFKEALERIEKTHGKEAREKVWFYVGNIKESKVNVSL